ncbi:MAG: heme-degrading domain-containing protein [Eubacteriales bacterium]
MELSVKERLRIYEDQEETLQFTSFNNDDAWELGVTMVELARKQESNVAIEIIVNGYQVFRYGFPGTNNNNDWWLKCKNNTVDNLHMSSIHAGAILEDEQMTIEERFRLDNENHATCGGSFPLIIKGTGVIGTIAVSGLPDYLDHQLIIDGVTEYFKNKK